MAWTRRVTKKGTVQYICPNCHDYHEFREDFGERTFNENFIFCRRCGARNGTGTPPALTPPGEWINVEEKLPETGDRYIVLIKQKYPWEKEWEFNVDVACYTFDDGYIDNCWDTFVDWLEGQETHVTHWMPLPEPPKKES